MLVGWARELTRRGFATLSISVKGAAGRGTPTGQPEGTSVGEEWHQQTKMLAAYGVHMMGVIVEESLKASRVLQAMPEVDGERIGVTGMSLGGIATWYAMACGPWLAAAAPICGGVGSVARDIHDSKASIHAAHWYVPNILRHFDHAEIAAGSVSPRPLMIVSPTEDSSMPKAGVDDLIPVARAAYENTGTPQNFEVHQPPGGHVFEPQYFEWMTDERVLGTAEAMFGPYVKTSATIGLINNASNDRGYWHSDWPFNQTVANHVPAPYPDAPLHLSSIWMLTPFNEVSGGTLVVPGSHRMPDNPSGENGVDHDAPYPTEVNAQGEPGSVLLFDSRLWHAVPPNRSDGPRIAIVIRFAPWWLNLEVEKADSAEHQRIVVETNGKGVPTPPVPRSVYEGLPEKVKELYRYWVED